MTPHDPYAPPSAPLPSSRNRRLSPIGPRPASSICAAVVAWLMVAFNLIVWVTLSWLPCDENPSYDIVQNALLIFGTILAVLTLVLLLATTLGKGRPWGYWVTSGVTLILAIRHLFELTEAMTPDSDGLEPHSPDLIQPFVLFLLFAWLFSAFTFGRASRSYHRVRRTPDGT